MPALLDLTCIHLTFDPQVTLNIVDKSLLSQPPRLALDVKVERLGQIDTKELAEPLTFPEKWTKMERHVRALLALGDVLSEVRPFTSLERRGVLLLKRLQLDPCAKMVISLLNLGFEVSNPTTTHAPFLKFPSHASCANPHPRPSATASSATTPSSPSSTT